MQIFPLSARKERDYSPSTGEIQSLLQIDLVIKRRSKSLGAKSGPNILNFGPFSSADHGAQKEKKKRKREKGGKRNRPPDRALTALGRE